MASRINTNRLSYGPLSVGYSQEVEGKKNVVFIVNGKRFPVHSEILCKISPVFNSMFNGDFKKENEICIHDVSAESFEMFIKIIYNGTRSMSLGLTPVQSMDCMIIANRYLMEPMESFLRNKLQKQITYHNVLYILPFCYLNLKIWSLRSKCWSVVESATSKVIRTDHFLKLPWEILCDIIENSRLTINEAELFQRVRAWAEYQRKLPGESRNAKDILGQVIYKIRFPLMTRNEFNLAKNSGLLEAGEIQDLESNFRSNATFPNQPRKNRCACRKKRSECSLCSSLSETSVKGSIAKPKVKPITFSQRLFEARNINLTPRQRRAYHLNYAFRMLLETTDVNANQVLTKTPSEDVNANKVNGNTSREEPKRPTCECFKYRSCPGFPNGKTGEILRSQGYNSL